MTDFTVHGVPGSPYVRAVLITLEEKAAPYRFAALAPGQHRAQPYLSLNPMAKIPTLVDGDFVLTETQAILRYIDRVVPTPPLTPASPRAAARMDQVMNINDWYLFQGVGNVIGFQRVVGPRLMGLAPDEAAIAAAMPAARTVFAELSRLLGEQPYFAGDAVSLADLLVATQIDFMAQTPEWAALTTPDGPLARWHARMAARPSLRATTWDAVAAMAQAA